ncbi:MAG: hypothetical protein Q8O40_07540, partial [Chloroflexota bacterium]|nr:hypothetical protein [Chloroflexota bacterium]
QGVDVSFKPPTIFTPRTSDGCFIVTSWVIVYQIRIISALAGNPRIKEGHPDGTNGHPDVIRRLSDLMECAMRPPLQSFHQA